MTAEQDMADMAPGTDGASDSPGSDLPSPRAAPGPSALSKAKLAKFRDKVQRSGIVYMSRVPPHLKPLKLRQLLEGHAKIGRIYMAPKDRGAKGKAHGADKAGKEYAEAWIEFEDKKLARAVAEMLNGNAMGGKHRSKYRDDLWTLKYLPSFKWDHLTEEIAYQKAVREKKLAQELASAKRERDFYLSKVAQAKKNSAVMDRKRKRGEQVEDEQQHKRREFQQREPKGDATGGGPALGDDVLSMFGR